MLQINVIRENTDRVLQGLVKRNFREAEELVQKALNADARRKKEQQKADDLKAELNADSKKIGELIKGGKSDEANALRVKVSANKDQIKTGESNLAIIEKELQDILYRIPNVPAEKVPEDLKKKVGQAWFYFGEYFAPPSCAPKDGIILVRVRSELPEAQQARPAV